MSKLKKMLAVSILVSMLLVNFSIVTNVQVSEAKATKSAMKFLKGTWVTAGNSGAVKFIFTTKYMKEYSLWNKDYSRVYSPSHKGKYVGKRKIVSTKKKNGKWIIKVGKKGSYTYYKGYGDGLECWWKDKSGWQYSGSDSIERIN